MDNWYGFDLTCWRPKPMANILLPFSNVFPCQHWFCSKTCLATVLIRSIFAREKLHERFSASAVFQRKIERINTVARHVLL